MSVSEKMKPNAFHLMLMNAFCSYLKCIFNIVLQSTTSHSIGEILTRIYSGKLDPNEILLFLDK
ncbi:CLUMA_CG018763, isoform A [Clunio marinus]|uniref:CLUMA_CG018763, isoform A n=1 Tax=Clunio marinus TaxID=568069 RepID=A0A1J1J2R3_9DIPT|nr:CLUMA_CG018763, isoform A [Clunio marinus]